MGRGISLSGLPFELMAQTTRWKHVSLLAQALRFLGKTLFQRLSLLETATLLHALLHSVRGGGSAGSVLITDRYQMQRDDG